jgi:tellurite resistance protein TerC
LDLSFLSILIQLIFLECILSLDNAAVMGAMVAHLPEDQTTPWPTRLRRRVAWADRLLGSQRAAALKVGLFGAYAGRILMLVLASAVVELTWVHVLGALYLLYLGGAHLVERYQEERETGQQPLFSHHKKGFWSVVLALNLADMAFSLDNVVAAIALSNQLLVVILGVGIGILIIRFGAVLFSRLIDWEPALEHAAFLLLIAIGVELLLEIWFGIQIDDLAKFAISTGILALAVLFARVQPLRRLLVVFQPFVILFMLIQAGIGLIIGGLTLPARLLIPSKEDDHASGPESTA